MITITITIESHTQAESIIHLIEQGIELEKVKLDTQHVLDVESIDSRLKILHGENAIAQLTIASLG